MALSLRVAPLCLYIQTSNLKNTASHYTVTSHCSNLATALTASLLCHLPPAQQTEGDLQGASFHLPSRGALVVHLQPVGAQLLRLLKLGGAQDRFLRPQARVHLPDSAVQLRDGNLLLTHHGPNATQVQGFLEEGHIELVH